MKYAIGVVVVIILTVVLFHLPRGAEPLVPVVGTSTDVATSSSPTVPPDATSTSSNTVSLGVGEEGRVGSLDIRVVEIVEDSRCPQAVQCIQAGRVRVKMDIAYSGGITTGILEAGVPLTLGDTKLTLSGVYPTKTTSPIDQQTYRFTFTVTS